jgi:hypothetical protein
MTKTLLAGLLLAFAALAQTEVSPQEEAQQAIAVRRQESQEWFQQGALAWAFGLERVNLQAQIEKQQRELGEQRERAEQAERELAIEREVERRVGQRVEQQSAAQQTEAARLAAEQRAAQQALLQEARRARQQAASQMLLQEGLRLLNPTPPPAPVNCTTFPSMPGLPVQTTCR